MKKVLIKESELINLIRFVLSESDKSDNRKVEDIQKELVYHHKKNIGKYGPKKDGVDGIMGPLTRRAYKEVYNKEYKGLGNSELVKETKVKNFHKIPLGNNNFRSAEPTSSGLKLVLQKYGIKNVIRFNGDGVDSSGLSIAEEKEICEEFGCNFYKLSSTKDQNKVNSLLSQGNTLIHCHHGADRTGGNVGGWLYSQGWGDTKKIWDYTTQYNGWESMVRRKPNSFVNGGYLKQAKKFGVKDLSHARQLSL
jgi:hypothetical protein